VTYTSVVVNRGRGGWSV